MQAQPPLISDLSMTCLQLAPVLLVLKLDLPFISLSSGLDLLCFLVVIVHFVNFLPPLPMPSSSLRLNTVQFDGDAIASDSLGMKRCEHPIRRIADKLIAMIFLFFLFFLFLLLQILNHLWFCSSLLESFSLPTKILIAETKVSGFARFEA